MSNHNLFSFNQLLFIAIVTGIATSYAVGVDFEENIKTIESPIQQTNPILPEGEQAPKITIDTDEILNFFGGIVDTPDHFSKQYTREKYDKVDNANCDELGDLLRQKFLKGYTEYVGEQKGCW